MITHGWADERTRADDVHVPQYANCHVVGGDKETTSAAAAASSDLVLYGGEEEKSREAAKSGSLTG